MEINISLADESLCEGCPLDNGRLKCKGGFTRSLAKLVEVEQESQGFNIWLSSTYERETRVRSYAIRPRECVVATERAIEVVKKIPDAKPRKINAGKAAAMRGWDEGYGDTTRYYMGPK